MSRLFLGIAFGLATTTALRAQEHEHHGTERLGRVVFPVSCTPEAQQRFERAMAMLHSFWWEEAPREFQSVLEADANCAMAHWGLAVNAWWNPFVGGPVGMERADGARAEIAIAKAGTQ